jgi:hypothetical protein
MTDELDRTSEWLRRFDVTMRAGQEVIRAATALTTKARAAVERSNAGIRLDGFPDEFQPSVLDEERVLAFLSQLPSLSGNTGERLRGCTFLLTHEALYLVAPAPLLAGALRGGYALDVPDPYFDRFVAPRLDAPFDLTLARDRASRARHAMEHWLGQVKEGEQNIAAAHSPEVRAALLREVAKARARRYAAAWSWEYTLRPLVAAHGTGQVQQEHLEAQEAATAFQVPINWGMPKAPG